MSLTPGGLRHPAYRRLFVGQGVSFVGYQVTAVAVPVQVYDISRSSFWVGVLGLVGLVPLIVFGLWGGAVADAVDRRKLLLVSAAVIIARWGGFPVAYATDALLFTVALYAAARLPPLPPLARGAHLPRPGLRSVIDGLRFIGGRPVLVMSFAVDIVAMVFAMPRALFPEVADTRFGGESTVGWLFAAIAIGSVLGGLSSGWIGRVHRQGVVLVAAVVGWGIAVALAGFATATWVAVALLAVAGAADLVSAVFRQTSANIAA